jgi:hypothetical protein
MISSKSKRRESAWFVPPWRERAIHPSIHLDRAGSELVVAGGRFMHARCTAEEDAFFPWHIWIQFALLASLFITTMRHGRVSAYIQI